MLLPEHAFQFTQESCICMASLYVYQEIPARQIGLGDRWTDSIKAVQTTAPISLQFRPDTTDSTLSAMVSDSVTNLATYVEVPVTTLSFDSSCA